MAETRIICPECQTEVVVDSDNDVSFCSCCGAKISLRQIEQMLENKQAADRYVLDADSKYEDKDFAAAGDLYKKYLEVYPADHHAVFRKGMCLALQANAGELCTEELLQSYSVACADADFLPQKDKMRAHEAMIGELCAYAVWVQKHLELPARGTVMESRLKCDECVDYAIKTVKTLFMLCEAFDTRSFESRTKDMLEMVIDECDNMGSYYLQYLEKHTVDNKGNRTAVYTKYKPGADKLQILASYRERSIKKYNNLPGTVKKKLELETALNEINDSTKASGQAKSRAKKSKKEAVKSFWASNPELAAKKKTLLLRLLLVLAAAFVAAVICYFAVSLTVAVIVLACGVLLTVLLLAGANALFNKKHYSDEVKDAVAQYKAAKKQHESNSERLKETKKNKKDFESTLKK